MKDAAVKAVPGVSDEMVGYSLLPDTMLTKQQIRWKANRIKDGTYAALSAALPLASVEQGGAVKPWGWANKNGAVTRFHPDKWREMGHELTPLYEHPPEAGRSSAEPVADIASKVAAEIMGLDHIAHRLDEQQQDETHGYIQDIVNAALAHPCAGSAEPVAYDAKREAMDFYPPAVDEWGDDPEQQAKIDAKEVSAAHNDEIATKVCALAHPGAGQPAAVAVLPGDLFSHKDAWRRGLVRLRDTAEVVQPDIDDRSYWQHELDIFDAVFAALASGNDLRAVKPNIPEPYRNSKPGEAWNAAYPVGDRASLVKPEDAK